MTYKGFVDIIRAVAAAVNPDGHFMHGRREDSSLDYNEPFPHIYLWPLNLLTDRGNDVDTFEVLMGFFRQDTPETSNEQREDIIAEMDDLSALFMETLYDQFPDLYITAERRTPEYRQFSGTLSGYGLTFRIGAKKECIDPVVVCPEIPVTIKNEDGETLYIVNPGLTQVIGNSEISINGSDYDSLLAEQPLNIPVINSEDAPVGDVEDDLFIIGDSVFTINGDAVPFGAIPAEGLKDIGVLNYEDDPVGILDPFDITIWRIESSNILINGAQLGLVPSEESLDIVVRYQTQGLTGTIINSEVIIPDEDFSVFLKGIFASGNDTMETITIDADNAGTYTSLSQDGASGSITASINGGAFAAFAFPLVLAINDTLVVKRTSFGASGFYKLTGTFTP